MVHVITFNFVLLIVLLNPRVGGDLTLHIYPNLSSKWSFADARCVIRLDL